MLTKTYKTSVGKTSNYQTSESSTVNDRQRILRNNSVEIMEDSSLSSSMTNSCSSIPSSSDIEEDQSEDENYGFESSGTHYTSPKPDAGRWNMKVVQVKFIQRLLIPRII